MRIPDIESRTDVAVAPTALVNPAAAAAPFEASARAKLQASEATSRGLQQAAQFMSEYGTKMQEARQANDIAIKRSALMEKASAIEVQQRNDTNYDSHYMGAAQELDDTYAGLVEGADSDTVGQLDPWYQVFKAQTLSGIRVRADNGVRDQTKGNATSNLYMLSQEAAKTSNEKLAQFHTGAAIQTIDKLVAAGVYSAEEGANEKIKFSANVAENRMRLAIQADPAKAKATLENNPAAFGELPADKIAGGLNNADSEIIQRRSFANTVMTKNASELDIAIDAAEKTSDLKVLPSKDNIIAMRENGEISERSANTLLGKYDKVLTGIKDYQSSVVKVDDAIENGVAIDLTDKNQAKAANVKYQALLDASSGQSKDYQNEIKSRFAAQIGGMPDALKSEIKSGFRSNDTASVLKSVDLANRLEALNPRLVDDLDNDDAKYLSAINANIQAGYKPQEAVTAVRNVMALPEAQKQALKDQYDADVKKGGINKNAQWLKSELSGFMSGAPDIDPTMQREFDDIAKQAFQDTGNLEGARKTAIRQIKQVWGKSEVGGNKRWIKNAPEKIWGNPALSDQENAQWMNDQLLQDLNKNALTEKGISKDRLMLTPNPNFILNGKPSYQVYVTRLSDGSYDIVIDKNGKPVLWAPDWQNSDKYKKMQKLDAEKMNTLRERQKKKKDGTESITREGVYRMGG